jgi:hypothetical protein
MQHDPIVQEVRTAREEIFAEEGYDLRRLVQRLAREQQAHSERLVTNVRQVRIVSLSKPRRAKQTKRQRKATRR